LFHIALDGPAGSGKSTLAKLISEKLKIFYVDSGALYRIIGFYMKKHEIDIHSKNDVEQNLKNITMELKNDSYYLNGEIIKEQIRNSESGYYASVVAKYDKVRNKVNEIIRNISSLKDIVIDGRDIGTVVLPDAEVKFFVTASVEERAKRRHKELLSKGEDILFEKVKKEILKRDANDSNRDIAPLKPAIDSIIIDTDNKNIYEVLEEILIIIQEKKNGF
jgi:cytidylate kinase